MKCDFCRKREAEIKLPFNPCYFCRDCFKIFFEKKILRNVRKSKLLKGSSIKIFAEKKIEKKIVINILSRYFSKSNKLCFVKSISEENNSAKTVEECAINFLESLLQGEKQQYPPERNLLDDVSIYEILQYAELVKIPATEPNFGKIYTMLKKISLKNPSIFFSIFQSAKKIQQQLKKQELKQGQDN